uniref:Uncharacterized protein n=1 Tax=Phytophthora ramorum TaxID=164328 RepID=H3GSL5_PHYRM
MFAAAPTPPSLEVATASFFHRHCNQQQQLFRSQYKRSNRTKGLKILRCFPHCCPEHIDRGYCGTSLSVSVELESRQPGARPTDEPPSEALAVYARFEAVDDDSIGPGEYMEAAKVDLGTQSEANLGGQWLAGTLETQSELSPTTHSRQHPDKEKRLIFHLNNKPASLWYYSWESETLAWLRAFFRQYAGSALDKHALHDCFVLFVRELHEQVNAQVNARTELQSLDNVAEEIIAAVYSNESFHAHRPQVRAILNGQRFAGWTAFVAQMREVYINVSVTSQIVRLEIALDVQTRTLYIRSTQGVAGPLDCMCVVLDGKDRVFSQFPNGMASCIDAGAHGDYVGEITAGQSDKLVVHLQVFEWSVRGDGLSYSMHMSIECEGSRLLCVSGDVLATTATASLTAQDTSVFREMSLREKREAVTNAHARKVEENHTIGWDTLGGTGPWEERGKFQLSYSKL